MSRDAIVDPALHRARRQRLLNALGDGVLLLATAREAGRNGDVLHEFRPGSDLHYLTGFPEPDAVLVARRIDLRRHHATLFVRQRDPERETWDGPRFGTEGAVRRFGVDRAEPVAELWKLLPELAPIPVPVWLATHRELHTSRRIRLVFDLLAEELGSG